MAKRKKQAIAQQSSSDWSCCNDRTFGWLLIIIGLYLVLSDLNILRLGISVWSIIALIFGLYFLSKSKK